MAEWLERREVGEGGREGGRGGREGWREGGREGAPVKEGRVKGTSEERTERGMDGARERGEGGSEWRRD